MSNIKFLVLTGDGINCENETARAIDIAGGKAEVIHINDVLDNPTSIHSYQGLVIPGGFSFGDDISSGQIMALKIQHGLKEDFKKFVDQKKPVLGICNGFQVLVKLGLLVEGNYDRSVTLAKNLHGKFIDTWVKLKINPQNKSPWLRSIDSMYLPVRHGEGRVVLHKDKEGKIKEMLETHHLDAIHYDEDINGSYNCIAGLTDKSGLVLGLMPHPEAAISSLTAPKTSQTHSESDGIHLFKNIVNYLKEAGL